MVRPNWIEDWKVRAVKRTLTKYRDLRCGDTIRVGD